MPDGRGISPNRALPVILIRSHSPRSTGTIEDGNAWITINVLALIAAPFEAGH
jgi:hypothetical protein